MCTTCIHHAHHYTCTHTYIQERLPPLLYNISMASNSITRRQPSKYVEFSYIRPSQALVPQQMLSVPCGTMWEDKPRCVSLWFCIEKYPLQVQVHILSAFMGTVFLQIWVCACSGDVTIR